MKQFLFFMIITVGMFYYITWLNLGETKQEFIVEFLSMLPLAFIILMISFLLSFVITGLLKLLIQIHISRKDRVKAARSAQ